jgi:hypothetical protein
MTFKTSCNISIILKFKNTIMKNIVFFIFIALIILSCKKNDSNIKPLNTDTLQTVYQFIKNLGYADKEIKDNGNEYLVDECMLFPKNIRPNFSIFGTQPLTKQYGSSNYVGYYLQPTITVRIDPSMNGYESEINGAIALWNNVTNCRIKFNLTTSTNQDILIINSNLGSGTCGMAYFPVNGHPGALVKINKSYISGNSFLQRQRTIAHELGHTIGFRHTNWQSNGETSSSILPDNNAKVQAMHVLGTPTGEDVNSLMNGGECGYGATSFSNYDILAVQFLYPFNSPVTGTVPVFRYYHDNTGGQKKPDHFYTIYITELGNGNYGWGFEGIGFFAYQYQIAGTVPVYRFYYQTNNDHFYTTNFNEGNVAPGYVYETIAFYASPSNIQGSVPIYRYYNSYVNDHFYTKNSNEIVSTYLTGYYLENTAFYAY